MIKGARQRHTQIRRNRSTKSTSCHQSFRKFPIPYRSHSEESIYERFREWLNYDLPIKYLFTTLTFSLNYHCRISEKHQFFLSNKVFWLQKFLTIPLGNLQPLDSALDSSDSGRIEPIGNDQGRARLPTNHESSFDPCVQFRIEFLQIFLDALLDAQKLSNTL